VPIVSVGLYRGACHVIEFMSPELIEVAGFDPTGMPVREAFPDAAYRDLFAVMDRVYATGRLESTLRASGLVTVLPWRSKGRLLGVSVHLDVSALPRALPLPVLPTSPPDLDLGAASRSAG
jgi:hypothetical protein